MLAVPFVKVQMASEQAKEQSDLTLANETAEKKTRERQVNGPLLGCSLLCCFFFFPLLVRMISGSPAQLLSGGVCYFSIQ